MKKLLLIIEDEMYNIEKYHIFHNQKDMENWLDKQEFITDLEVYQDSISFNVNHSWKNYGSFIWIDSHL